MAINAQLGDASQNSYVVVSQANTYFTNRRNTTTWDNLTATNKEIVLIQAARDIDQFRFYGDKYYDSQGLNFPRDDHDTVTGNCATPLTATSFSNTSLYSTSYNEMPEDYWKYGSIHITLGTPIREVKLIKSSDPSNGRVVASPTFSEEVTANTQFTVFKPIFKEIHDAQCEQALYLLDNATISGLLNYKNLGAQMVKIGDATVTFNNSGFSSLSVAPVAKKLLAQFIDRSLLVYRK